MSAQGTDNFNLGEGRVIIHDPQDDSYRFSHTCDRKERGVIIVAPLLGTGHQVTVSGKMPKKRHSS